MRRISFFSLLLIITATTPGTVQAQSAPSSRMLDLWERAGASVREGKDSIAVRRDVEMSVFKGDVADRAFILTATMKKNSQGVWEAFIDPSSLPSDKPPSSMDPLSVVGSDPDPVFDAPLVSLDYTGREDTIRGIRYREAAFSAEGVSGTVMFPSDGSTNLIVKARWDKSGGFPARDTTVVYEGDGKGGLVPVFFRMELERRFALFITRTVRASIRYSEFTDR